MNEEFKRMFYELKNSEISMMKDDHKNEIRMLKDEHKNEIRMLKDKHDNEIRLIKEKHKMEKDEILLEKRELLEKLNEREEHYYTLSSELLMKFADNSGRGVISKKEENMTVISAPLFCTIEKNLEAYGYSKIIENFQKKAPCIAEFERLIEIGINGGHSSCCVIIKSGRTMCMYIDENNEKKKIDNKKALFEICEHMYKILQPYFLDKSRRMSDISKYSVVTNKNEEIEMEKEIEYNSNRAKNLASLHSRAVQDKFYKTFLSLLR